MGVHVSQDGDGVRVLVQLGAALGPEAAAVIRQRVRPLLGTDDLHAVEVSMAAVRYADSVGLGALVLLKRRGETVGIGVTFRDVPERLGMALELLNLRDVFGPTPVG